MRISNSILMFVIAMLFVLPAPCRSQTTESSAVEFLIVTGYGDPVNGADIELSGPGGTVKLEDVPSRKRITLPSGQYVALITMPGFDFVKYSFQARAREQVEVVGLKVGAMTVDLTPDTVIGRVESTEKLAGCEWIRLKHLFLRASPVIARIGSDGTFSFPSVGAGYMGAVVFGKNGVCHVGGGVVEGNDRGEVVIVVR